MNLIQSELQMFKGHHNPGMFIQYPAGTSFFTDLSGTSVFAKLGSIYIKAAF
jgi:hypothetical protein